MEACEVCGEMEKITEKKLVSVCGSLLGVDCTLHTPTPPPNLTPAPHTDCYKKYEDRGRMHRACLKSHLAKLLSERSEKQLVCYRCRQQYRVHVEHTFVCDCAHLCTPRALSSAFELVVVAFTMVMTATVFLLIDFKVGGYLAWLRPRFPPVSVHPCAWLVADRN